MKPESIVKKYKNKRSKEINDYIDEIGVPGVRYYPVGVEAGEPFLGFFFFLSVEFGLHMVNPKAVEVGVLDDAVEQASAEAP